MLSIAIYSPRKEERQMLERNCRSLLARYSDEDASLLSFQKIDDMERELARVDRQDVICLDITEQGSIASAERLRSADAQMLMVLTVDEKMSPRSYMRPTILASSVLFCPLRQQEVSEVLDEVLQVWRERNSDDSDQFVFTVSGETRRVARNDILYFEAREKRVFLRTRHAEYGFYETMEHLSDTLPKGFLRCHKSYIVNMAYMKTINLARSELTLGEMGIMIPVSRTYKPALKAWREECI